MPEYERYCEILRDVGHENKLTFSVTRSTHLFNGKVLRAIQENRIPATNKFLRQLHVDCLKKT